MSVIRGIDPWTGDLLTVTITDGMVSAISRGRNDSRDLPHLAPALIDLQVNGYRGHDCNGPDMSADDIIAITEELCTDGVTTWVPTIITGSEEDICHSLAAVEQARAADPATRRAIPYCHVEGPFLSDRDGPRGAHDLDRIRPVDPAEVERWRRHGTIGTVTISPHWPNSQQAIAQIVASGVSVSIGHTHASCEQIRAAADAGASLSTHLGNGIFATLPRHPNPIWSQLADRRLTTGLIGDGHHLPMETLSAMIRAKGIESCFLISDSVALAGSPAGIYDAPVGGRVELTQDGRLLTFGTDLLAGAGVGLAFGLHNVVSRTTLSLADVLDMMTRVPGRVLAERGHPGHGLLRVGAPADIVEVTAEGVVTGVIRQGRRIR